MVMSYHDDKTLNTRGIIGIILSVIISILGKESEETFFFLLNEVMWARQMAQEVKVLSPSLITRVQLPDLPGGRREPIP